MAYFLHNWRTTALGSGALFTALGALLTSLATGDTSHLLPELSAIASAAGLIFAGDAKAK